MKSEVEEMRKMLLFYLPVSSMALRLNPLTKFFFFFMFTLVDFLHTNVFVNLVQIVALIFLLMILKIRFKAFKWFLAAWYLSMISIVLTWLLVYQEPGNVVFKLPWTTITDNALWTISGITSRWFLVFFFGMFLITTTRDRDIILGFRKLRLPYELSILVMLGLKSTLGFLDDYKIIKEAQMSKAQNFSGLKNKILTFPQLLYPIITSSLRKIWEIDHALESRGFKIGMKRTYYFNPKIKPLDYVWIGITCIVFSMIVIARYYFGFLNSSWPFV